MRFYPDLPSRRAVTVLGDAFVLLALVAFAWVGWQVREVVDELAVLPRGIHAVGSSVQDGFETVAAAADDVPEIGEDVAEGLRRAGEASGGEVAEAGREGEEDVHRVANLLGLLTFLLPAAAVLAHAVPPRVQEIRKLTAAERVLRGPYDEERRRLFAMRAAFSLPYGQLLAYTRDPLGDLAAGRYDALVAAAFEDAGLLPPRL